MANNSPIFVGTPRNEGIVLSTASTETNGSTSTTLYTADPNNGSRIHGISAVYTGSQASPIVLRIFISDGATRWIISEKTIPAYTAIGGVAAPSVSFVEYGDMPFLDPADRFLTLGPNGFLSVAFLTVPDSPFHIVAHGGDY